MRHTTPSFFDQDSFLSIFHALDIVHQLLSVHISKKDTKRVEECELEQQKLRNTSPFDRKKYLRLSIPFIQSLEEYRRRIKACQILLRHRFFRAEITPTRRNYKTEIRQIYHPEPENVVHETALIIASVRPGSET